MPKRDNEFLILKTSVNEKIKTESRIETTSNNQQRAF